MITHLRSLPLLLVSHQINMCWTRHPQVRGSHFFIVIFLIISHLIVPIILIPLVIEVPFSLSAMKYIYSFDIPDFTSDIRTRSAVLRYVCVLTMYCCDIDYHCRSVIIYRYFRTLAHNMLQAERPSPLPPSDPSLPPILFPGSLVLCSHLSIQEPQRTRPGNVSLQL